MFGRPFAIMTKSPLISVVMSVYNGAESLPATLDSILTQKGVDFEFIIINDGSSDHTARILQKYSSKDDRLKIFEQENRGLTRSLIRGCSEARGDFIARQDAGDISLPGRLKKQAVMFRENPYAVLVAGGTQFVGPEGEELYCSCTEQEEAEAGLHAQTGDAIRGPSHHGCTMFRRSSYFSVGGYRSQFRVAQDLDLWTRLVELGRFNVIPDIIYQAKLAPSSISSLSRKQQVRATDFIVECKQRRKAGKNDDKVLTRVQRETAGGTFSTKKDSADFYYFIAGCLRNKDKDRARHYYKLSLKHNSFHFKALFRLLNLSIFSR